jgi:tellurite resistance protein TerC
MRVLSSPHAPEPGTAVGMSAWLALIGVIAVMLAVDLFLHRHNHAPSNRAALRESLVWVAVSVVFGLVLYKALGSQSGTEFFTGYVIEKSLSIDNVFVWAVVFATFATPSNLQHRVLFWGIFGALSLRAVFIFVGSAVLERFWWMVVVFGAILIASGVKVLRHRQDEGEASHGGALKLLSRFMPVSQEYDGQRFFTKINGVRHATPLFAALVVVELTDVVFAFDSVPAILAVSRTPFVVFSSNAFAILGLRAMYFLLAASKDRFHYLAHALGSILVFVGAKMMVSHWWHVSSLLSLGVIGVLLTAAVLASEAKRRRELQNPTNVS